MASGVQMLISFTLLCAILIVFGWFLCDMYRTEISKHKKKSFKEECEEFLGLASESAKTNNKTVSIAVFSNGSGICACYGKDHEEFILKIGKEEHLDEQKENAQ